mgnify:CR=1 FL=1
MDDGIHKPEELIHKITSGEVPEFHAKGGAQAAEDASASDSFGRSLYKNLMNGVSHMLPFVVGGGIMIALAFLLDDYSIDPSNFGMNTPLAAFFKTVGSAAFSYMLPILAGFIAMSIADRPGLAVGFAGGVLAMNGTNFAGMPPVRPPASPAASWPLCWPVSWPVMWWSSSRRSPKSSPPA